ncbi:tail adaptor [Caudoviricetes sp.]|nr:tail adaptor [Caudoviricetes sp.]
MATTGTYNFNPGLGEITLYAYMNVGIRPTSLLQEHMEAARMASNMMLSRWANQGVNLWAVDLIEVPVIAGIDKYNVDDNTVVILDAYARHDDGLSPPIDRPLMPISRSEYASYSNKTVQGPPTVYWFDRTLSPTITLWPVPDGQSVQVIRYYRVRQIQDASMAGNTQVEIPYLWLEAFADGLTYRLARIWKPEIAVALKAQADESYKIAADQNIETSNVYISPMIGSYFR